VRRTLAAAAIVGGVAGLPGCGGARSVVVRDEAGDVLVEAPLPASGRFAIEYRHSYYRVAARETFAADASGFRMVEVASPSEAVLDYYEMPGRKRRDGWMRLSAARPVHFDRLPLVATPVGRRTLVVGGRHYALYERAPRHVTIDLEG
jgi:hypothetical protein